VPPYRTTLSGTPAPRPIEDRVATLGTRLADLEPRLDVWQSRLDRFELLVNEGRTEIAGGRALLDEIREAVGGFDRRLASVEGFEGRLGAIEGFDSRLAQAEAKATTVESKLASVRSAFESLEHRIAMLELPPSPDVVVDVKRVTRLEARIAMLEASSRSLTERVEDLGGE
jgi:chromosome segregation ATPase